MVANSYFLEENDMSYWIEDKSKPWLVPGNDPVWVCQACGGGQHVYGEMSNFKKANCPDCGRRMFYKYDIINTVSERENKWSLS